MPYKMLIPDCDLKRANKLLAIMRSSLGMTTQEFADGLGLSKEHILRIESGKNRVTASVYLASCMIFSMLAKNKKNATTLSMLNMLVDLDQKVNMPEPMKEDCVNRCWHAKQSSARRYGMGYVKENVCKEYEDWLKTDVYRWVIQRDGRK